MDCRRVRRRLVAYLDDELAPAWNSRVDEHLTSCTACQEQLAALDQTTPRAPELPLDDGALHQVHLRILSALDEEPLPTPASTEPGLLDLIRGDVRMPRGLVVLYAGILLAVIGWAASGALVPAPASEVALEEPETLPSAALEMHPPAAYTPSDGWF